MIGQAAMEDLVRRQIEIRRRNGLGVLDALADVRHMYADVITAMLMADRTVPKSLLKRFEIANDWEARITFDVPGAPDDL